MGPVALEETLKVKIKQAMKDRDDTVRDVLRVVLGQIQLEASSSPTSEEQKLAVVRRLIKSNQQTLGSMAEKPADEWTGDWKENAEKLRRELVLLESLLPRSLSEMEIIEFIRSKAIDVVGAKSDGQAMGAVMKELKAASASVDSATVKATVESLRRSK
jgi:uncharacterized protein